MISQDHVDQYNDEGYTIVENLFSMKNYNLFLMSLMILLMNMKKHLVLVR